MTTLHTYVTPAQAQHIEHTGALEPDSLLPGTDIPVLFAFPDKAHLAWNSMRHDENPGLAKLLLLRLRAEEEGAETLVHFTFEAPAQTTIYDRSALERGNDAYHASARPLEHGTLFMVKPEAAIRDTIPKHVLTANVLDAQAIDDLFDAYGFYQR
jgi:hypothetical protein